MKYCLAYFCIAMCTIGSASVKAHAQPLALTELTPSVLIHTTYMDSIPANGLVYVDGSEAAIVDTPWTESQTGELIDLLAARGVSVVAAIPTHWHDDCMGGLAEVQRRNIPTYSLAMTADIAREKGLPIPETVFVDSLTVPVGGSSVVCRYFGGGHTADNIVVWVPEEQVLFGGCLIKTLGANGMGNTDDAAVEEWSGTVHRVIEAYPDVRTVVPGHGPHGDAALLTHTLDVVEEHTR